MLTSGMEIRGIGCSWLPFAHIRSVWMPQGRAGDGTFYRRQAGTACFRATPMWGIGCSWFPFANVWSERIPQGRAGDPRSRGMLPMHRPHKLKRKRFVPFGRLLVGVGRFEQVGFFERTPHELETDGQFGILRETARQAHPAVTNQIG